MRELTGGLGLLGDDAWFTLALGVLALTCAVAWTSRYVVRQYVEARLDLARLPREDRRVDS